MVDWLVQPVQVPAQDTVYFDEIRIHPTAIITTVNIGSDAELRDTLKLYGISPMYLSLFKRVSRLEDFSLDLSAGHYEAVTSHKVGLRYTSLVINDVLRQLHEVVFNFTKRIAKVLPFSGRREVAVKVRQPLVAVGGTLITYGPGPKPAIVESEREHAAALVVERFFASALRRKAEREASAAAAAARAQEEGEGERDGVQRGSSRWRVSGARPKPKASSCLGCGACAGCGGDSAT